MKKIKNLMETVITEAIIDKEMARELELYISSDSECYKASDVYLKNMVTKIAQGKFDMSKVPKLVVNYIERCADRYVKEFHMDGTGKTNFNKPVRDYLSQIFADNFLDRIKDGEGDKFVPKKYQKDWEETKAGI